MSRVVVDPRDPLDYGGDARQGPQLRTQAVSARPLAQRRIDPFPLRAVESGLASRSAGRAQSGRSSTLPVFVPTARTLAAYPQRASDLCHRSARSKQPRRSLPPSFERAKISPRTKSDSPHVLTLSHGTESVTILCEAQ